MLLVSNTSCSENRKRLLAELRKPKIPSRLCIDPAGPQLESVSWREYWEPCRAFFTADARLVQRLNRLKAAWRDLLRRPHQQRYQITYCWRYFGLLHHTLGIAASEPWRGDPLPALHRVLAFQVFAIATAERAAQGAGAFTGTNPLYLLGRLSPTAPPPTPRHVPLVLPLGKRCPHYCYRQLMLDSKTGMQLLVCPSTSLQERPKSFEPIDRLTRLLRPKPDPYWKPRSRLLARRVLAPLFQRWVRSRDTRHASRAISVLDLWAGTGHLAVRAWRNLGKLLPAARRMKAAFHLVDSSEPTFGRSFGLSRDADDITHVEWTKADVRVLLDDDNWLAGNGPFDWVLLCRLLDNASNFLIEEVAMVDGAPLCSATGQDPCQCLAPRRYPAGIAQLAVQTVRRSSRGGTVMPQLSLSDYFKAMQAVTSGAPPESRTGDAMLAVRRFNPASLTTASGRSVLAQLMTVASALVIEDLDLEPDHLRTHKEQFGLAGTAAIHFLRDGFNTEAHHYVVTTPALVDGLCGERLW